jgi:hypothetical protein
MIVKFGTVCLTAKSTARDEERKSGYRLAFSCH